MTERIELQIDVPDDVSIEGLVFVYRCGLSERWVKHKDTCGRLDGPWHYCATSNNTSLAFSTLEEAQAEAVRQVVAAERERLIRLAAERAVREAQP